MNRLRANRYLAPIGLALLAGVLTIPLSWQFGGNAPLALFVLAVIVATAIGGRRAGLIATAASLAVGFIVFEGRLVLPLAKSAVLVFSFVGLAITLVVGRIFHANRELRHTKERLEESNRLLTRQSAALARSNEDLERLAYGLAHDLGSQLRGIRAFTELLVARNRDKFDDDSIHWAETIEKNEQRMEALISGLMRYASVTNRGASHPIPCGAVVSGVVQDLHHAIESVGAKIEVGDLPLVQMDESQLRQLFTNLIGNALKYRGIEPPHIQIEARKQDGQALISVRDNGIGFDMEHRDEIFGIFKRLHGAQYEGSGIGLALCKAVVERGGGKIWAESAKGQGSTFYFTLPTAAQRKGRAAH
jgi:light-regulated signal transduction histidine kinase (bacteriophytochrome)